MDLRLERAKAVAARHAEQFLLLCRQPCAPRDALFNAAADLIRSGALLAALAYIPA